ncbi:MAG: hypothetical protein WBE76_29110 [Terracidiphilus sp.]
MAKAEQTGRFQVARIYVNLEREFCESVPVERFVRQQEMARVILSTAV